MKKFFILPVAFVGMLFLASCGTADDPVPPTPPSYLEVLKADVNTVLAAYPEFKKQSDVDYPYGYFREADYVLNGFVSDLPVDELKAVSVVYGFAYSTPGTEAGLHILEATRDLTKGLEADMTYQRYDGPGYPQDVNIIENLDKIITLEHALKNLKESNVIIPKTKKVSLCFPEGPLFDKTIVYRFGLTSSEDEFMVFVNAETGEVKTAPTGK